MAVKVAINGYGRIGRNILRAIHEYGRNDDRGANRERARADARPHGIRDVVRADRPRHVQRENTDEPDLEGYPEELHCPTPDRVERGGTIRNT